MKYFAILRESLREALDSKVLYVLFALSTIVILFVATLSFESLTADKAMGQFFMSRGFPQIPFALNYHKPKNADKGSFGRNYQWLHQFQLDKVELLRGAPDAPESDYVLTITRRWPGELAKEMLTPEHMTSDVRGIFADAVELGLIRVGDVQTLPNDPTDLQSNIAHYRVTVLGTPHTCHIWAAQPSLLFGVLPLEALTGPIGFQLYMLASIVLSFGSWAAVLLGVIITSFFIPNMLHKGTIDMLLVKPIHRWTLLLYKYIGGLTFIFLSTAYAIIGMWFVIGVRTGIWAHSILLLIFTITFFFAILYAISTFVGVLTRSTITSILTTIGAWFLFFVIGTTHQYFETRDAVEKARTNQPGAEQKPSEENVFATIVSVVHAVTPRTADLSNLNDLLVYCGFVIGSLDHIEEFHTSNFVWWESLLVSGVWIAVFLGVSCFWFSYKDY